MTKTKLELLKELARIEGGLLDHLQNCTEVACERRMLKALAEARKMRKELLAELGPKNLRRFV